VPQGGEDVLEHRLGEGLSGTAPEHASEALLGGAEALDWEDRDRSHLAI
jgi:hypothetical protein